MVWLGRVMVGATSGPEGVRSCGLWGVLSVLSEGGGGLAEGFGSWFAPCGGQDFPESDPDESLEFEQEHVEEDAEEEERIGRGGGRPRSAVVSSEDEEEDEFNGEEDGEEEDEEGGDYEHSERVRVATAVLNADGDFDVLSVSGLTITSDSDEALVKRAYRLLAKMIHPDKLQGFEHATAAFQKLLNAFNRVRDGRGRTSGSDDNDEDNDEDDDEAATAPQSYDALVTEGCDRIQKLLDVYLVSMGEDEERREERLSKEEMLVRFEDVKYVDEEGSEHYFISDFLMDKVNLKRCDYDTCFKYFSETHNKVGSQYVVTRTKPQLHYEIMSEKEMIQTYKHYSFKDSDDDKARKGDFISDYIHDDRIDAFQKFGVFPGALRAPSGIFDLWTPFAVESLYKTHPLEADLETRIADLTIILTRVSVLSNHEKLSYEFILTWCGHMFQYPEIKAGVILALLSKQGAGKSEFVHLLKEMIGKFKVFESTAPEKHVWGQFNMALANAYLVVLNEVGEKGFANAAGKIKALITDGTIQVEEKCAARVESTLYPGPHPFISHPHCKHSSTAPSSRAPGLSSR